MTNLRHDRNIRRLAAVTGTGIVVFAVLLLATIAFAGWSANRSATEREHQLVLNAFNRSIVRTLNEQKSVAWWDDSVSKITDGAIDLEFTDANFGIFLTETYGQDEVYILTGDGKPFYAFYDGERQDPATYARRRNLLDTVIAELKDPKNSRLMRRPDLFRADQTNYKILAGAIAKARWAGHILSIDGHLAIVAAMTIVPNVDMTLARTRPDILVTVTNIDPAYIKEIGRALLLDDLALSQTPSPSEEKVSEKVTSDDGLSSDYITWTTKQPGRVLLNIVLPIVATGVFAFAVLAFGILRKLDLTSSSLARRERQARHAAKHDALSGLPNRLHFADRLNEAIKAVENTHEPRRIIVAYVDVDNFKDVNDTLGHHAGDQLIKLITRRLRAAMHPEDFFARYGGDEFAVFWVAPGDAAEQTLASRIEGIFATPFEFDGQQLRITASVGIAVAPEHGTTGDDLLRHADIALYAAKNRGRNRWVVFTADMAAEVMEKRAIETALREAIENNELRLNYQPVIRSESREMIGMEALLRWRHPSRGEISPAMFIPIAEQSGLMPEIGEWVVRRAFEDSVRWPSQQISVNISPMQFRQPEFLDVLKNAVQETKIDTSKIVLEITEGVLLESTARTRETLDGIRELGFLCALDDFGTGYSSLSYLCQFRFDKIKVDRSFVRGMSKSRSYAQVVNAVIALGRGLGMRIVAEGVETPEEVATMTAFGCHELQGYYFSKPLEPDALTAFIETYVPQLLPPQTTINKDQTSNPKMKDEADHAAEPVRKPEKRAS